jgi:proton glutamate symport protein
MKWKYYGLKFNPDHFTEGLTISIKAANMQSNQRLAFHRYTKKHFLQGMKIPGQIFRLRYLLTGLPLYGAMEWLNHSDLLSFDGSLLTGIRFLLSGLALGYAIRKSSLTHWIFVAMLLGVVLGYDFPEFSRNLNVLSKIFMKLVKCVIAPLLLGTLITGIAGHSNLKQLGRLGLKSLIYFEVVTTFALFIGLAAINLSKAGEGIQLSHHVASEIPKLNPKTPAEIILHIFPENIAKSIADGEVLQIVIFCLFFSIGLVKTKENYRKPILRFAESLSEVMFKFTDLVMLFAPLAVGGAVAYTVSSMGLDVLKNLALLVATLYAALLVFLLLVLLPIALIARIPVLKFLKAVREPVTLAFATASSESALPKALENMRAFGVPDKIVGFVLPTGYTFNLDGTTLYLSLASVFVAQAAGIDLSLGQQMLMVLTLMLTSKGVAGVARASLVILAGTAAGFGLPEWPIAAILGVDAIMDMARTAVNVIGNCLASAVVARWEGELEIK